MTENHLFNQHFYGSCMKYHRISNISYLRSYLYNSRNTSCTLNQTFTFFLEYNRKIGFLVGASITTASYFYDCKHCTHFFMCLLSRQNQSTSNVSDSICGKIRIFGTSNMSKILLPFVKYSRNNAWSHVTNRRFSLD